MVTLSMPRLARLARSLVAVEWSGSIAMTCLTRRERALVMTPEPAPISMTWSRFFEIGVSDKGEGEAWRLEKMLR